MQDLVRAFEDTLVQAVERASSDAFQEARRLSSGDKSQAELDSMDNPYAKRHGTPQLPPEIINDQAQLGGSNHPSFLESWARERAHVEPDGIGTRIYNDNKVADFLKYGTRSMFARPIEGEVETYLETELEKRLTQEVKAFDRKLLSLP